MLLSVLRFVSQSRQREMKEGGERGGSYFSWPFFQTRKECFLFSPAFLSHQNSIFVSLDVSFSSSAAESARGKRECAHLVHTRIVVPARPSRRRRRDLRRRRQFRPKSSAVAAAAAVLVVVVVVVVAGCSPCSTPASSDLGSGSAQANLLELSAKNGPPQRSRDDGGGPERGH